MHCCSRASHPPTCCQNMAFELQSILTGILIYSYSCRSTHTPDQSYHGCVGCIRDAPWSLCICNCCPPAPLTRSVRLMQSTDGHAVDQGLIIKRKSTASPQAWERMFLVCV